MIQVLRYTADDVNQDKLIFIGLKVDQQYFTETSKSNNLKAITKILENHVLKVKSKLDI